MHEYGHNAGIQGHNPAPRYIMAASLNNSLNALTQAA